MKKILVAACLLLAAAFLHAQDASLNVVVIGAHPDDCEGDAGGLALLYAELGHHVKFISMTNGDAGHFAKGGGALAKIRMAEAQEAGRRLGVKEYVVMDNHDGELMPTLENRKELIREIRKWNADIVIGPRPNDYHPDHRYTAILMQDAAFMVTVPNIAPDVPALEKNPVFLFAEDRFQKPNPFEADIAVDIDRVFEQKIRGMAAHESQYFEWLPWLAGTLDQIPEDEAGRLEYLGKRRNFRPGGSTRDALVKWYGETGETVQHAEGFEICEYGRRPGDQEILRLFPMLPQQDK